MTRTFTYQPDDLNVALPYNIFHDRTPFQIPFCKASDKTMMFAGQSVRSSMTDLLRFYQAYIKAMSKLCDEATSKVHSASHTEGNPPARDCFSGCPTLFALHKCKNFNKVDTARSPTPFKQIAAIIRLYISRPIDSLFEQTYVLGWNRTQFPGKLDFGANSSLIDSIPSLGVKYPGKLAIWHGGNMLGTSAAVCLLPYSQTGIIVLQNSLGLCDATEWACQLILDIILAGKPQNDYFLLARESTKNGAARMQKVQEELDGHRIPCTTHRPLTAYTGRYWNSIHNLIIEVSFDALGEGLDIKLQAREDERYHLRHYHYDIFVWNTSYDETVKRAQYRRPAAYYKIEFELIGKDGEGEIS